MKKIAIFLSLYFVVGCGSGDEGEAPTLPDAGLLDTQASYQALPDTLPEGTRCADPLPVTIVGGVPFGPAPADVSKCPCGVGCVLTFTPDRSGCYCEYVCASCN